MSTSVSTPTPDAPEKAGRSVVRGGAIMAGASVAMRMASLIAQIILGRILVEDDFGLYAIALSLTAMATALRSTIRPVLVEMLTANQAIDSIYRRTMWVVIGLSALAMACTPVLAGAFDEPDLLPLLLVMFATMPLQVMPAFGLAKINQSEAYGQLGSLLTIGIVIRQAAIIAAALAGLGAMSFAAGAVIGSSLELALVRRRSGKYPKLFTRGSGPHTFSATERTALRWLPISTLGLVFATSGDYPAAAAMTSVGVVGVYFFAYQLTAGLSQPFHLAVNSVLVPTFAKLEQPEALRSGYQRTVRSITLIASVPFGGFAVIAAFLTHLTWGGRWDSATTSIILFSLFMPLRLVHPACLSIMQGRGLWRQHAAMMWFAGLILVASAAIGASTDDPLNIAIFTLIGHGFVTLITAFRVAQILGASPFKTLAGILEPWIYTLASVGLVSAVLPLNRVEIVPAGLRALMFLAIVAVPVTIRFRHDLRQLASGLR